MISIMTGQFGENGLAMADAWIPFPEALSEVARTHADESTRAFAAINLMTVAVYPLATRHDRWSW